MEELKDKNLIHDERNGEQRNHLSKKNNNNNKNIYKG